MISAVSNSGFSTSETMTASFTVVFKGIEISVPMASFSLDA